MRFRSIRVENFRAIRFLEIKDLSNAVVVAGPNGCGKSSLFDAIRLLKSAYGQYHQHEFQSWFNEFQINVHRIQQETNRFLHNPGKPLVISAELEISDEEREYLRENARELILQMHRGRESPGYPAGPSMVSPTDYRAQIHIVEEFSHRLATCIDNPIHVAQLFMNPSGDADVTPSPVVELLFSTYTPEHLGVIEYHGASRNFVREQIGGVNLHLDEPKQRNSQNALYNTQNKYQGIKTEMAQSFVRHLIAKEAGIPLPGNNDLQNTLDELFKVFFPGKKFLGIRPSVDGAVSFPVRLENGSEHDIDELSSGEKEVLLGYLRLRNNAPRNSIILFDEPELHLNPRLIRGLPRFYQKHLGEALGNQLLLITHSDTLLREAVDEPAYSVFHMHPSYATPEESNQLDPVSVSADVERAVIDLMGDLATYSPRSKVVLLEGAVSEVDENILKELFPKFVEGVNLISVGNKRRVGAIHDVLDLAAQGGKLPARFYSIVDKDFEEKDTGDNQRFKWNVYHIENYLLEPRFIREAMHSLNLGGNLPTEHEIVESLKRCAEATVNELIRIRMEHTVNRELVSCISMNCDPKVPLASGFRQVAERSYKRMEDALGRLSPDFLFAEEQRIREELAGALTDGTWLNRFRGRDILQKFTFLYKQEIGVSYERFRNLIINRMRDSDYRPSGMISVIEAIQNA